MATSNDKGAANTLNTNERNLLIEGLDKHIASLNRFNAKENNKNIKDIREQEINHAIILKNKLMTQELTL